VAVALVKAGADPHRVGSAGESPLTLLRKAAEGDGNGGGNVASNELMAELDALAHKGQPADDAASDSGSEPFDDDQCDTDFEEEYDNMPCEDDHGIDPEHGFEIALCPGRDDDGEYHEDGEYHAEVPHPPIPNLRAVVPAACDGLAGRRTPVRPEAQGRGQRQLLRVMTRLSRQHGLLNGGNCASARIETDSAAITG
jgi:hypothetical protein